MSRSDLARRLLTAATAFGLTVAGAAAATVGSGSPNYLVQQSFVAAFNRATFSQRVQPPTKDVHALGSPGLVQEFASKTDSSVWALVSPDPTLPADTLATYQIFGDIYTLFNSIGVGTVGYPLFDTATSFTTALGACDYQVFTKDYALFVCPGQSGFVVKDPFFTEWNNGGGIQTYGPALSSEIAVTSASGVQGTEQLFASGTIFSSPVSSAASATFGITEPFNTAFNNAGGYGRLGFPTSDVLTVGAAGLLRQTFENGRIEMTPGGTPAVLYSIATIGIPGQAVGLNLAIGQTATLSAVVIDMQNQQVTGRALNWSTSNGSVVKVTGNGDTAVVQAIAAGSANIYVSGEGKTSAAFTVRVGASCCAVGNGAPTPAIGLAFQSAVSRNGLSVMSPAAPVERLGPGYIEILTAADGSGTQYTVSEADGSGQAYVLSVSLSQAYFAAGGYTGPLGYPASDALPGGSQMFTSGAALAGSPVRVVPSVIAVRWKQLGGAAGVPGPPTADAATFISAGGVNGISQAFAGGAIFALTSGPKAGQAYFSAGPILSRYLALGGPVGVLGLPLADITNAAVQSQTFEGGYIDLQPGVAAAVEHLNPRHPALSLSSATVIPGGRLHIGAAGFAPGATLMFTVTGQSGFSVQTASGAFGWDIVIPAGTSPGTVTVQVTAQGSSDAASASYSIKSLAASIPRLTVISGDRQTGMPGSALPNPIVAQLQDVSGNPLSGVPVSYSGSAGTVVASSFITDQNGQIALTFRLPPASGVAVGSLTAGSQVVNFSALAVDSSVQNFPTFSVGDPPGSLVASLAALLRYYQNFGYLSLSNGLATPDVLAQFVAVRGGFVNVGPGDNIANPWIAAQFASAALGVEGTSLDRIRDVLSTGAPLALVLNLTLDGGASGSNTVDAIGVGPDGSILIVDPNPIFARTSLTDYLTGFYARGHLVLASIGAVLRVGVPVPVPGSAAFTVASPLNSASMVSSPAGACVSADILSSLSNAAERFQYCDGTQNSYELDFGGPAAAAFSDLTAGTTQQIAANSGTAVNIIRTAAGFTLAPQPPTIGSVTDSAAFTTRLAPGELITIFGAGFGGGSAPLVRLGGATLPASGVFPYQINTMIPAGAATGDSVLQVQTALSTASKTVTLSAVAPAIFAIGSEGAIVNQAGTLNGPQAPAQRGQYISIYCTGLGATALSGGLQLGASPVIAIVNGVPLTPSYAGQAPGFAGLYQINVSIPTSLPPNSAGAIQLLQAGVASNIVGFALQ